MCNNNVVLEEGEDDEERHILLLYIGGQIEKRKANQKIDLVYSSVVAVFWQRTRVESEMKRDDGVFTWLSEEFGRVRVFLRNGARFFHCHLCTNYILISAADDNADFRSCGKGYTQRGYVRPRTLNV